MGALTDVTKFRGSYQRVLEYMEETRVPLLIENGYRAQAQIISDNIIMQNLSKKVEEIIKSKRVNFATFTNRQKGEDWLRAKLATFS